MGNKKLEKLLDKIIQNPDKGFPEGFTELMDQAVFYVPAVLPPDTPEEIVRQMMTEQGENKVLPEGANPSPCVLENGTGEKFLPLFTSLKQLEAGGENAPEFPLTLNIPFEDCINMLKNNPDVHGAVINPYTHNLVVPVNVPNKNPLEQMLDEFKTAQEKGFSEEFTELLNQSIFYVPAVLPPDTPEDVIRQIIEANNTRKMLPEGVNPNPCILETENGDKFLPLFTSTEQIAAGGEKAPKFPLTLNIPFPACIDILKNSPEVHGAVINPYTHNLVVPVNPPKKIEKEVTMDEYHVMMRQVFESKILPKHLFEEKEAFAEKLNKERGSYIRELFEEAYVDEIACPYIEDDFDFLSMRITDDLLVIQMTMPSKYKNMNTASTIFLAWDNAKQKAWYYALVQPSDTHPVLVEKFEDASLKQHETVYEESGLLTSVIERIQNEND